MKQSHFLPLMLLALFMSSCTTYQYTARQTEINRRPMDTKEERAGILVDYTRRVSATSSYQLTRRDAIAEAEFICIQEANIDVVVDPIFKIEFSPFKWKKNYRATIIGYAGMYEQKKTLLDESKEYTIEDIEKYKLLYDPNFLPYYYQKEPIEGGDVYNYYIKSGAGAGAVAPVGAFNPAPIINKTTPSLMLQNQPIQRPFKQFSSEELTKAKKLRDAGISLSVIGTLMCIPMGVTMFVVGLNSEGQDGDDVAVTGAVFMGVGAATAASGVVMASVGGARYNKGKKAQRQMDLTLNTGANGIGIGLTF